MRYKRTGRIVRVQRSCRCISRPGEHRVVLCELSEDGAIIAPPGWELAGSVPEAEALFRAMVRGRRRDIGGQRTLFS